MKKTHQGRITLNTQEKIERPYIDELERKLEKYISNYLEEHDFTFVKKEIRVNLNIVNQSSTIERKEVPCSNPNYPDNCPVIDEMVKTATIQPEFEKDDCPVDCKFRPNQG